MAKSRKKRASEDICGHLERSNVLHVWHAGFLPAEHQGIVFDNSEIEPEKMIPFLRNKQLDAKKQRADLDTLQTLNREHLESFGADEFLEGRIKAMEAAYRMQFEASDVFDVRREPEAIRDQICCSGSTSDLHHSRSFSVNGWYSFQNTPLLIPLVVNSPASIAAAYRDTSTLSYAPLTTPVTGDVVYVGRFIPTATPWLDGESR
jgi:hypothetical protein